jgi:hypothetical protein
MILLLKIVAIVTHGDMLSLPKNKRSSVTRSLRRIMQNFQARSQLG